MLCCNCWSAHIGAWLLQVPGVFDLVAIPKAEGFSRSIVVMDTPSSKAAAGTGPRSGVISGMTVAAYQHDHVALQQLMKEVRTRVPPLSSLLTGRLRDIPDGCGGAVVRIG